MQHMCLLMHICHKRRTAKYNTQHMSLCHMVFKFLRISYMCIVFTLFLPLSFPLLFLLYPHTPFHIHDLLFNYYNYTYICMYVCLIYIYTHTYNLLNLFDIDHM